MFRFRATLPRLISIGFLVLWGSLPAMAQSQSDVDSLRAELESLRQDLVPVSAPALVCSMTGSNPCPIRLFLSGRVLERIFDRLLSNRQISFRKTGDTVEIFNSGDNALGCGYWVQVVGSDLGADLNIKRVATNWSSGELSLTPNFRFEAWGSFHAHVRGPACPFTGCSCQLGGGGGSTLGARTARDDSIGFRVTLSSDANGWARVRFSQPQEKKIDVTLSISVEKVQGTVGIPTTFTLPAMTYFEEAAPAAFGVEGDLSLPGGVTRKYRFTFTGQPLELTTQGFAARLVPNIQWQ